MDLYAQGMNKVACLIDTGAGPILINKSFVHPTWAPCFKHQDFIKLRSANKQPIRSEELILLYLRIGNQCILVWFGTVVEVYNLSVDLLLGTSCIDQYLQSIFSVERMLVP